MAGGWSQGLKVTIWKTVLLLEAFWLQKTKRKLLLDRGRAGGLRAQVSGAGGTRGPGGVWGSCQEASSWLRAGHRGLK